MVFLSFPWHEHGASCSRSWEQKPEGFIEGFTLVFSIGISISIVIIERVNQAPRAMVTVAEWAHGIIGRFESGFTQGTVGFGIDAFAMEGLKLDSGDGRRGARSSVDVLPHNKGQPEDSYSKVGGAAKVRFLDTVVKVGDGFHRRLSLPMGIPTSPGEFPGCNVH